MVPLFLCALFYSGNVVGYHVEVPCITCLQSCHNGHMWIFNSDAIATEEIVDKSGESHIRGTTCHS